MRCCDPTRLAFHQAGNVRIATPVHLPSRYLAHCRCAGGGAAAEGVPAELLPPPPHCCRAAWRALHCTTPTDANSLSRRAVSGPASETVPTGPTNPVHHLCVQWGLILGRPAKAALTSTSRASARASVAASMRPSTTVGLVPAGASQWSKSSSRWRRAECSLRAESVAGGMGMGPSPAGSASLEGLGCSS